MLDQQSNRSTYDLNEQKKEKKKIFMIRNNGFGTGTGRVICFT